MEGRGPTCLNVCAMIMALAELEDSEFACFVPICDLVNAQLATENRYLRTIGFSKSVDLESFLLTLEYNNHHILVDTHCLFPFKFREGAILQIIGRLESRLVKDVPEKVIKAQLYRYADGLDIHIYHSVQRQRASPTHNQPRAT